MTDLPKILAERRAFTSVENALNDCRCGVKFGWPLRHFQTPQFIFKSDCCFHDFLYTLGGTAADRRDADMTLHDDMLRRIVELKEKNPQQKPGLWLVAWLYYFAVRLFGTKHWNKHPAQPAPIAVPLKSLAEATTVIIRKPDVSGGS